MFDMELDMRPLRPSHRRRLIDYLIQGYQPQKRPLDIAIERFELMVGVSKKQLASRSNVPGPASSVALRSTSRNAFVASHVGISGDERAPSKAAW